MKFYEIYDSFNDFYTSFFRGNEVEFYYNGKRYYVIPYCEENKMIGVCFGEANVNKETVCLTKDELYNISVGKSTFGDIIPNVDIVWNNF